MSSFVHSLPDHTPPPNTTQPTDGPALALCTDSVVLQRWVSWRWPWRHRRTPRRCCWEPSSASRRRRATTPSSQLLSHQKVGCPPLSDGEWRSLISVSTLFLNFVVHWSFCWFCWGVIFIIDILKWAFILWYTYILLRFRLTPGFVKIHFKYSV